MVVSLEGIESFSTDFKDLGMVTFYFQKGFSMYCENVLLEHTILFPQAP